MMRVAPKRGRFEGWVAADLDDLYPSMVPNRFRFWPMVDNLES